MVCAQQTVRDAVEGANPHAVLRGADQLFNPVAHLGGGLVGKGHGQNGVRRAVLYRHQPSDPVYQNAGFTTAGTGQYQQIAARRGNHGALFVVQAVEQKGHIHRETYCVFIQYEGL